MFDLAALDRTTFVSTYSQPVRITPMRFLGYGGKDWTDPALVPDGGDDVSGHLLLPDLVAGWTHAQREMLAEVARRKKGVRGDLDLLALEE